MRRERVGMVAHPACAGHLFAILFVLALVRHDVCRREGNDLGASRAHHHRGESWVIRQRGPVGELTRETVGAMDGLGGAGGRAIKGHQKLIPKDPETVEQVVLVKACKDLEKHGIAMAGGNRIEEGADLVVTGNLLDAKQGLGVMASLACLEPALVLSKRWRWGKEEAEGA